MTRLKKSNSNNFATWNEVIGGVTLAQLQADGLPTVATADDLTGRVKELGTGLEFDTANSLYNSAVKIDETHVVNFWESSDDDGHCQMFNINLGDGTITAQDSITEFATNNVEHFSAFLLDNTHVMVFYSDAGQTIGTCKIFAFVISTGVITETSTLEFTGDIARFSSAFKVDAGLVMNFWEGESSDGFCRLFSVSTTYVIAALDSALEFDTSQAKHNSAVLLNPNTCINFWSGFADDGFCRTFSFTTGGVVTALDSVLEFDTNNSFYNSVIKVDETHVVNAWSGNALDGFIRSFEINILTGEITAQDSALEFLNADVEYISLILVSPTRAVNSYRGNGNDGFLLMFDISVSDGVIKALRTEFEHDVADDLYNSLVKLNNDTICLF